MLSFAVTYHEGLLSISDQGSLTDPGWLGNFEAPVDRAGLQIVRMLQDLHRCDASFVGNLLPGEFALVPWPQAPDRKDWKPTGYTYVEVRTKHDDTLTEVVVLTDAKAEKYKRPDRKLKRRKLQLDPDTVLDIFLAFLSVDALKPSLLRLAEAILLGSLRAQRDIAVPVA